MSAILGLYILFCLPGLIAAMLVRLWAHRRKRDRYERAWLFALTIGLLCSPGFYGAGNGAAVVALVVPSLFAAIYAGSQFPRMWVVFLVSSAITTAVTFGAYVLVSKSMSAEIEQDGA